LRASPTRRLRPFHSGRTNQSRIHPGASISTHFLHFLYTERVSLYKIFSSFRLRFSSSKQNLCEVMMDIVFIGAIAAFLLATCAFANGCEKLGER
jgi:hypothetical protein